MRAHVVVRCVHASPDIRLDRHCLEGLGFAVYRGSHQSPIRAVKVAKACSALQSRWKSWVISEMGWSGIRRKLLGSHGRSGGFSLRPTVFPPLEPTAWDRFHEPPTHRVAGHVAHRT